MGTYRHSWYCVFCETTTSAVIAAVALLLMCAFGFLAEASTPVASGWHPWYEIKADPENSNNLIICGTKWDAEDNAPFGFVYASLDGGATWRTALEDRSSRWVTEHSCAFGANHKAYFVSEASKVIEGQPHHGLGTTRLFVSADAGQHWIETIKTGWADYSTSAVSSASGKLYTFFQSTSSLGAPNEKGGNNVGLLVFSADGRTVAGPFFNSQLRTLRYRGVYPSNALTLKSGAVVALYYGRRLTSAGWKADLGILRAESSARPSLQMRVVSHPVMDWSTSCFHFADNSLSYDAEQGRLFLVYIIGCNEANQMMLTSSADEGRTWTKSVVVVSTGTSGRSIYDPSVAALSNGALAILWNEGQERRFGHWLFSYVHAPDLQPIEAVTELSSGSKRYELNDDSLWTSVFRGENGSTYASTKSDSTITLNVATELNTVWRAGGVVATGNKVVVVWLSGNSEGSQLSAEVLDRIASLPDAQKVDAAQVVDTDVTRRATILYAGSQRFDNAKETLTIHMRLANRGPTPLRVPIKLKAEEVASSIGTVSILNATNGMTGTGALWDISDSVTGGQIPPDAASNPFCLSFRMNVPSDGASLLHGDDLLILRLRVMTSAVSVD